jgi:hypothetical protein
MVDYYRWSPSRMAIAALSQLRRHTFCTNLSGRPEQTVQKAFIRSWPADVQRERPSSAMGRETQYPLVHCHNQPIDLIWDFG